MAGVWRLLATCAPLAACTFGPLPLGPGDGGAGPDARVDAGPNDPDAGEPDGGPCPEAIVVQAQVNDGTTPVTVLVGDTVRFTAKGSCVKEGPANLIWTLSPADGTLLTRRGPDDDFTVYSVVAGETYVVSLQIDDATGGSESVTFQAFTTVGFAPLGALGGDNQDQRGLDVGGGYLWIGTLADAWQMPLATPGTFTDISVGWNGGDVPNEIDEVFYDASANRIWFAPSPSAARVWRGDIASESFTAVAYDLAVGGSSPVNDMRSGPLGIYLATDRGVTSSATGAAFAGLLHPDAHFALLATPSRHLAGGQALIDLLEPTFFAEPYGGGDNKIRHMVRGIDGEIWLASDDQGLARADEVTGAADAIYTTAEGTPSNRIRSLAVEPAGPFAGDVWFATDAGIGRWKRDRDETIALENDAGLTGHLTGRWIVFTDFGGGRTIYESTSAGLVYAHLP